MPLVPESERGAYTTDAINAAMNQAADAVLDAINAPDEGVRDAINLVVNASMHYLDRPEDSLQDVIAANYDQIDEDGDGPIEWAQR